MDEEGFESGANAGVDCEDVGVEKRFEGVEKVGGG